MASFIPLSIMPFTACLVICVYGERWRLLAYKEAVLLFSHSNGSAGDRSGHPATDGMSDVLPRLFVALLCPY